MSWNLLVGFVCYLHKDGCLLLHLLFHFLQSELKKMCSTRKYPIHLLPRYNLLTHPYILLPAFNFNGQSSKKQLLSLPTHEAYD